MCQPVDVQCRILQVLSLTPVSSGHLQRAYLPLGRQGLFPLAEAGDPPDMMPSEQVTTAQRATVIEVLLSHIVISEHILAYR